MSSDGSGEGGDANAASQRAKPRPAPLEFPEDSPPNANNNNNSKGKSGGKRRRNRSDNSSNIAKKQQAAAEGGTGSSSHDEDEATAAVAVSSLTTPPRGGGGGYGTFGRGRRDGSDGSDDGAGGTPGRWGAAPAAMGRGMRKSPSLLQYMTSPNSPLVVVSEHCQHQWVAVLATTVVLVIIVYVVFGLSAPALAGGTHRPCVSAFGSLLGDAGGIGAFSNCHHNVGYTRSGGSSSSSGGGGSGGFLSHITFGLIGGGRGDSASASGGGGEGSAAPGLRDADAAGSGIRMTRDGGNNAVMVGLRRYYTGVRWHSLEFARRFWLLAGLGTFPSLAAPDQVMGLRTVVDVSPAARRQMSLLAVYNLGERPKGGAAGAKGSAAAATGPAAVYAPNAITLAGRGGLGGGGGGGGARNATVEAALRPAPADMVVYARNPHTLATSHAAIVVRVAGPVSLPQLPRALRGVWERRALGSLSPEAPADAAAADAAAAGTKESDASAAGAHERRYPSQRPAVPTDEPANFFLVYVAEQNWDNAPWPTTKEEAAAAKSDGPNATETASKPKGHGVPGGYSRVLLLAEYSGGAAGGGQGQAPAAGDGEKRFYLQDTHNNRILGWVRSLRYGDVL